MEFVLSIFKIYKDNDEARYSTIVYHFYYGNPNYLTQ